MSKVSLTINGKQSEVESGTTLLDATEKVGAKLAHFCFGNAICSTCRVRVVSGEKSLSEKETKERVSLNYHLCFDENVRLACQTRIVGPDPVEVVAPKPFKWMAF